MKEDNVILFPNREDASLESDEPKYMFAFTEIELWSMITSMTTTLQINDGVVARNDKLEQVEDVSSIKNESKGIANLREALLNYSKEPRVEKSFSLTLSEADIKLLIVALDLGGFFCTLGRENYRTNPWTEDDYPYIHSLYFKLKSFIQGLGISDFSRRSILEKEL